MAEEFICMMPNVTKVYPPSNEVIKDMSLSFLPGREDRRHRLQRRGQVHAAADHGRRRHRHPRRGRLDRKGKTAGMLEQEPQLDETKTVRENVEDGLADGARRARPLQRGLARDGRSGRRLRRAAAPSRPTCSRSSTTRDGWNLDTHIDVAMNALRVPEGDLPVHNLSGGEKRRIALAPPAALGARPAAAGRAHQPPRRRERAVARAVPRQVPRHDRGDHP